MSASMAVLAQSAPPGTLPEALKDIPRASGVCRSDPADAKRGEVLAARAGEAPDLSCGLTLAEANTLLERTDTVLVDMRPASEFAQYHVDRALNLKLAELRSKHYLHGKAILLMGSGKGERELYVACGTLKRAGFKQVRVLRGGTSTWLAAEREVVGRAPDGRSLPRLSAEELWAEAQFQGNVVLLGPTLSAIQQQLPFSATVSQWTPEAVKGVLERRRKELKGMPLAAVVLAVGQGGFTEAQIASLPTTIPAPVLVYGGTKEAFERAMALQKAVWTAEARGPKRPGCGF
ncbi:MAG: rhodanese-like domain-containing protein [Betaproteobacteria bacterium]|nr:rhodanese-like domain-containing protein [Betaproteobacteria bacterium]